MKYEYHPSVYCVCLSARSINDVLSQTTLPAEGTYHRHVELLI